MIVKFAGEEATGYNWTMLQGANELGVSGNTLSTYNETTGITTTFDIIQYPNATELMDDYKLGLYLNKHIVYLVRKNEYIQVVATFEID